MASFIAQSGPQICCNNDVFAQISKPVTALMHQKHGAKEAPDLAASALKKLWIWSCRSGRVDLPADFAVMEAQHRAVIEALTAAMAEPRSEFKRRWEDQQHGTVMKDLLR
jgi:hypothetical protein